MIHPMMHHFRWSQRTTHPFPTSLYSGFPPGIEVHVCYKGIQRIP